MAENTKKSSGRWAFLTNPPPKGWRPRTIGFSSLLVGAFGAFVGWQIRNGNPAFGTGWGVGMAMVLAPYYVVPRTKTDRLWQGLAGGVAAGLIAAVGMAILSPQRYLSHWTDLVGSFVLFLAPSLGSAWLFTRFTEWVDKRRQGMPQPKFSGGGQASSGPARPPRVHHRKRKKRRR